jgi:hypothetical protein
MFILGRHGTSAQACKQPNTCPNTLACNYEMVIYVVGFSPKRNFCYVLIFVAQIPLAAARAKDSPTSRRSWQYQLCSTFQTDAISEQYLSPKIKRNPPHAWKDLE